MTRFNDVLLTTDLSLGDVAGKGKNFFGWLWKTLFVAPWKFLSNRSKNQMGLVCSKAF